MIDAPISFASAYRQITPTERAFVDGFVADAERQAERANERISLALHRPITKAVHEASRGMLDRPLVRAAISERINDLAAAAELTPRRIVKEWMAIAFSSMSDYFEVGPDGMPRFNFATVTPEAMRAIKSIKYETGGTGRDPFGQPKHKLEITLHDKLSAMDSLTKFMGMYQPDNPYWRAESATPVVNAALPSNTTVTQAAEQYAAMLNDD